MPRIEIAESPAGPALSLDAEPGARLLDLCDEARAPVRFGCRAARCTTCRVAVLAGSTALLPPGPEEAELLRAIGADPTVRLACQAVVGPSAEPLALRWIGPRAGAMGGRRA